jgi:hypothetical protein
LKQFSFFIPKSTLLAVCLSVFTVACTPTFDWRSTRLSSYGDRYVLTFPGKTVSAQKSIALAGEQRALTLTAVQIDGAQFAFGSVPASSAAQAQTIAEELAQAFTNNLKVNPAQTKRSPVALPRSQGGFEVSYPSGERFAQARFIWTEHAAYELLVVDSAKVVSTETAETFIRSMQFE